MKFLLFADLHYAPGMFKTFGRDALRLFQKRAKEKNCDMIIHCGDLCHPKMNSDFIEFINAYNNFEIPSYNCMGNHDMDFCSTEEIVKLYNMPNDYYYFDKGGYRFIVTNTSYFYDGTDYVKYDKGNYFAFPDTREFMPPCELEWLKNAIETSDYPCILFSHASFERCDGLINRDEVLKIIDNANKKKKHSVLMCINGHHHRDNIRILNNVIYYDMNSASTDWVGKPHDKYPAEECAQYEFLANTLCFNDPLHAIVTIDGTTVTIEGMQSSMYLGVDRKLIGRPEYDAAGRPVTPYVTSAKITIG